MVALLELQVHANNFVKQPMDFYKLKFEHLYFLDHLLLICSATINKSVK